jgi:fructokinase
MRIPPGDLDVLTIGEILIDFISLEEAESLHEAFTFRKYLGGSPANIAVNVAKLGGKSALIAKCGIGAFGKFLKAELRRAGVNAQYLVMDHRVHTSFMFISRTSQTPDFEASRNGDYKLEPNEIPSQAVQNAKIVHASTFALSRQPLRSSIKEAFKLAQKYGKIVSLDPNYSSQIWPNYQEAKEVVPEMMKYATITKPSSDDAERFFGEGQSPEEYIQLYHAMGPKTVIFTMGSKGILLSEEGQITYIPSRQIKVVDATGAGDSFWAGFLIALIDGNSLKRSILFAREIVERKLTSVGPLPDDIGKEEIYNEIDE